MSACTPEIDSRSVGERAIGDLLPLSRLVKLRQEQTAVRPPALRRPVTRPAALAAGLEGRVRFVVGDAERLPLADSSVDAVMCECALCTFPDKAAAARELARVLSPGGKLALSDMTADSDRLPQALRSLDGWIACISDARPLEEIAALLVEAELEVIVSERHDEALHAMVDRAEGRLRLARAFGAGGPPELTGSIERALTIVSAARNAIADRGARLWHARRAKERRMVIESAVPVASCVFPSPRSESPGSCPLTAGSLPGERVRHGGRRALL